MFRGNFGLITSDLLTNALNNNFEEYLATANIQAPPGDPRPVFRLSQGPPAFQFNINQDGSVPFIGTNYRIAQRDLVGSQHADAVCHELVGRIPVSVPEQWLAELLYQGSSGVGLLNNWDINVLPLNVSNDPAQLDQIRSSTRTSSRIRSSAPSSTIPTTGTTRTTGPRCESRSAMRTE